MDYKSESNIRNVYRERDDFIIVGLTGWTGSGCSTAADILSKEKFISIKMPDVNKLTGNDKRKALIVNNYISAGWKGFFTVKVSAVLTMFFLEIGRDAVYDYLRKIDVAVSCDFSGLLHEYDFEGFRSVTIFEKYLLADKFNCDIKKILNRSVYTKLYQDIGNVIRTAGGLDDASVNPMAIQVIPKLIVDIISSHRELSRDSRNYYVIDAIRNPFEAIYLKDRFSAFYMVGITVDDSSRRSRLLKDGMKYFDLVEMDYREGASLDNIDLSASDKELIKSRNIRPKGVNSLVVQDVAACLEKCDIYVGNQDDINFKRGLDNPTGLAGSIVTYVALMHRPGLITPTPVERCMQVAITAKLNSGCLSRQVGAVITDKDYSILSIGWNDVAKGQVPCLLRNASYYVNGYDLDAFSNYELSNEFFKKTIRLKVESVVSGSNKKKMGGRVYSYCFKQVYNDLTNIKNQVHTRALHAEENAFLQLAKRGVGGVDSGYLFTTASPCELCSKKSYQMGIKKIYYIDPYPGIATSNILQSGSARPELILFSGAVGRAFHQLYHPVMPYKDEMVYILS